MVEFIVLGHLILYIGTYDGVGIEYENKFYFIQINSKVFIAANPINI